MVSGEGWHYDDHLIRAPITAVCSSPCTVTDAAAGQQGRGLTPRRPLTSAPFACVFSDRAPSLAQIHYHSLWWLSSTVKWKIAIFQSGKIIRLNRSVRSLRVATTIRYILPVQRAPSEPRVSSHTHTARLHACTPLSLTNHLDTCHAELSLQLSEDKWRLPVKPSTHTHTRALALLICSPPSPFSSFTTHSQ